MLAVSLADGSTVWDSPVSPSHGRTELERLNDIDSAVKVMGEDVFVAGFQGRAAMLAIDSGQIWWTRDVSSYRGVDVDDEQMYVSTSTGELVALKRRSGVEVWRNDSLKYRSLSAPAVVGEHVVVADLDGYVHWFDRATGTIAGRAKTGGDRVTNPPLAVNDIALPDQRQGRRVGAARPSRSRNARHDYRRRRPKRPRSRKRLRRATPVRYRNPGG